MRLVPHAEALSEAVPSYWREATMWGSHPRPFRECRSWVKVKFNRQVGFTPNSGHGLVPRKLTLCATCCCEPNHAQESWKGSLVISVLIGVLIIVVVGAICFWAIDKFATDRRLANLLKLLVVLVCLGAFLQRVLPLTY
jgi:hypothetical protein